VAGGLVVAAGAATTDSITNAATFFGEWGGFVGVPVWLSRTRGTGRMSADFGLRFGGPGDLGLGVAGGAGAYFVVALYGALLRQFDSANLGHEAHSLFDKSYGAGFVLVGLCAALLAPVAEEIFFRGLVQRALQRRLGGVAGLVITATIFGFVHLGANPLEAVPPLVFFGVVLGMLAWRTGRLGPGIIAHVTFNSITVVAFAISR
jgi:hypothetical protein